MRKDPFVRMFQQAAPSRIDYVCLIYLKESHSGAIFDHAVLNLGLLGDVVGRVHWRVHPLYGEESGQIGCVRRYDDEREEPPDPTDDPGRQGFGHQL